MFEDLSQSHPKVTDKDLQAFMEKSRQPNSIGVSNIRELVVAQLIEDNLVMKRQIKEMSEYLRWQQDLPKGDTSAHKPWMFKPIGNGGELWFEGHPIATLKPAPDTAGHVLDTGRHIADRLNAEVKRHG